jgi:hypothetical protein
MAEKIILELRDKDFVVNANIITPENKTNIIRLESHIASDIKNTLVNM